MKSLEKAILQASLSEQKKTYAQIAQEHNYAESYVKHLVAPKLWKLLSQLLGEKVNRTNCHTKLINFIQNLDSAERQDKTNINATVKSAKILRIVNNKQEPKFILEKPEGQVPLDSSFYIQRTEIEARCYQEILQPRTFIQIISPHKTGKTSLLSRIVQYAKAQDFYVVSLSINQVESETLTSTSKFMRWLCCNIIYQLNLKSELDIYWEENLGTLVSSTLVLQECVLKKIDKPLILAIDEINNLFEYPGLNRDFFSLLRNCYKQSKNQVLWQKLKPIIVSSINIYTTQNKSHAAFDIGIIVNIPQFSLRETEELIKRHFLEFTQLETEKIHNFTGGSPYLLRLALYYLKKHNLGLEKLFSKANIKAEIFQRHLDNQLYYLEREENLLEALLELIEKDTAVEFNREIVDKLYSWGLIHLRGYEARISCDLYRDYFRNYRDRTALGKSDRFCTFI